jgi:low temperature requirement protein LtrA
LARDAYTYLHVVMVAGIIVAAVGDELVIAHPTEELPGREVAAVVAGPAIYLLAQALFRLRMAGTVSWKRLGGALACVAVGFVGTFADAVVVLALVVAVLVTVIGLETVSGARRRRRGELAPLERLNTQVDPLS